MILDINELLKSTNVEARDYQKRIVVKGFDLLVNKKLRSILIESPTGSGKTIMALLLMKALHERCGLNLGWVAMRKHLLKQALRENIEKNINAPIKFISMFQKKFPTDIHVILTDEAQHDVTNSMAHIHATINPQFIIGLTATPFRTDKIKLCFDSIIKDVGIPTLIADGYLSPYYHYTIPNWDVNTVVDFYIRDVDRWGKSIIYFNRLEQCFEAQQKLLSNGIISEVVYGSSDADKQIDDFRNNKITVLINCMKLTEGFDAPDLKTVFCRPSSKPVTIQMCGRVLRKHKDHLYKQIVQCDKTPYPFQRLALAKVQYIYNNGEWRSLEINKNIEAIGNRTVQALANIPVKIPKYIKDRSGLLRPTSRRNGV